MKKIFYPIVLLILLGNSVLIAQQKGANISFNELAYNFGQIDEAKGVVSHKFEFTNTGSQPLVIQNVSTTCGCTTPEWTKEPVKPGEKGYVSAEYNPANRPGQFEKFITVQSTANPPVVQLKISGNVNPKPLRIEDQYPFTIGGIRLKSNQVSFGTVYKGQQKTNLIELINNSDKPQTIKISEVPRHIKVNIPTPTLVPKQTGIVEVVFNSALKDDWGFVYDRFNLMVNDPANSSFPVVITANIDEDFSSLTSEQKSNAPAIKFENVNFNFGNLKRGETITHEYNFTNEGKSNLLIRKVMPSCGCTAVNTSDQVISPGNSGIIRANFNSTGYTGKQNKTITVITNDPVNSKIILWIRGDVVDPAQ
jgi:hypothetical protein